MDRCISQNDKADAVLVSTEIKSINMFCIYALNFIFQSMHKCRMGEELHRLEDLNWVKNANIHVFLVSFFLAYVLDRQIKDKFAYWHILHSAQV